MPNTRGDAFTRIQNAARLTNPEPTDAQKLSGEYKKGTVIIHGLVIDIENARSTSRTGKGEDGRTWRNLMPDHYGDIRGTMGADGDPIDVWVGPWPEGKKVFAVNQLFVAGPKKGQFDEHKLMICYPTMEMARNAYRNAYDRDFQGFGSMVEMTLNQLFWWLKYGAKDKPLSLDVLPPAGLELAMSPTLDSLVPYTRWNGDAQPTASTLDALLYKIRRSDAAEGLLLDCVTMPELVDGHEVVSLDALVVQASTLSLKMEAMRKIMDMAGNTVKTVSVQMSDPMKRAGSTNVAVLFELTDGQTVTIWFHNPDTTPAKLAPTDDLISWKWLLNKKDVTIVVAPERGQELNVREVSRRIMRLAEKNSAAFQKANVNRAAKLAEVESLKGEIATTEKRVAALQHMIEVKALEPAAKPEKVSTYEQGRINSKTGRWNRDGYLYAFSTPEDQVYRWVSETSVQRERIGTANAAMEWLGDVLMGMGDTGPLDAGAVVSRLKFVSGDDLLAAVATPAAEPAKLSLSDWEGEVIRIMEEDGEGMTNSDAQGVYMVQQSKAKDAHAQGKTPAEGAQIVLNASLVPAASTGDKPIAKSEIPDDVRSAEGVKANFELKYAIENGNNWMTAMFKMLKGAGLDFDRLASLYPAYRSIVDELVYGKFEGSAFSDYLNRIKSVAGKFAIELEVLEPAKPRKEPMNEAEAYKASQAISEQIDSLSKSSKFVGMVQILDALFFSGVNEYMDAYSAALDKLNAARTEYFELATKFEKDAATEAEQAKQDEYTSFDASQVKLPTAVQLGSNKPNTFTVFEGNGSAWSNGAILDTSRPSFIQKALDEFIGGGKEPNGRSAKTLRKLPATAIDKVMGNAKGANIKVEPIAFNDGYDLEKTGKKNGWVDETKRIPNKSIVLADENKTLAVLVDARYFGYFFKTHKGCEFFVKGEEGAILVKKSGETIGLIMPRRSHGSAEMLKYAANAKPANGAVQADAEPLSAEDQAKVATVDAAYAFADATDKFKSIMASSVDKEDYSPFLSAKTIDEAAKSLGMSVKWATRSASFDSVAGADCQEEFDACQEFDSMPELAEEGEPA